MPEETPIISAVEKRFSDVTRYTANNARVVEVKPFLWGKIHQVRFPRTNASEKTVYVWEPEANASGGAITEGISIFENQEEIVSFVSLYQPRLVSRIGEIARRNLLAKFTPVDLMSGIIGILLTITIIFIVAIQLFNNRSIDVPGIFANVLTTIVGFYFGKSGVSGG
jgi:hypothetical protein